MHPIVSEDTEYVLEHFDERELLEDATVLITGCAGFLGFLFMHVLVGRADDLGLKKLIALDNFKLGRPEWLDALDDTGVVDLRPFDVTVDDLAQVEGAQGADYVLHMASIASPTFYRQYPIETLDANIWGLRRLLDFYRGSDLKGLLFFSSSEIYGDPADEAIPTPEDYRGLVATIGPRACYDEAKRFGETLCYLFSRVHGVPVRMVRPFNNYGPGMRLDDRRAPADFARAVVEGEDIVLLSDGTPTRTFCYVADAVVGYLKALVYREFDVFNIGTDGPEISIRELADIYARVGKKVTGYGGSVRLETPEEAEYLTHNPSRRCPKIDKARSLLGYEPGIGVEEGVERYLRFSSSGEGTS